MFSYDNQWKFWTFSIFFLWNWFSGKWKPFSKNWSTPFLVESNKIENASFPYKIAISEANVKTNRMVSTKLTKNGVSPRTTLSSWKFCFSLRISYKESIWCTNDPNVHIRTCCKRWSFIWRCFFPVTILKELRRK